MLRLVGRYGNGALLSAPINYVEPSIKTVVKAAEAAARSAKDIDFADWYLLESTMIEKKQGNLLKRKLH
ncbi:MAG: hypothetical protein J7L07_08745 [Candidatus Odinarchaeota archaeon]|nr:hypothetical protein [Candidatus Odinarchaeota archaeon]